MRAQTLLDARISIEPESPVVDQWCRIELIVETDGATALRDMRLSGFPEADKLVLDSWIERPLETRQTDKGTVEVRRYEARARPRRAGDLRFQPVLHAAVARQSRSGFVTRWVERRVTHRIRQARLRVRDWPASGRPPEFDGAVGDFVFSGGIDPPDPAIGDLVRLTLTVEGRGWLGHAMPRFETVPPGLQGYPEKELRRSHETGLTIERVFVVSDAAADRIPGAVFAWFDPESQVYRREAIGPFAIAPRERKAPRPVTTRLRIDVPPPVSRPFEREFRLPRIERHAYALFSALAVLLLFFALARHPRMRRMHGKLPFLLRSIGVAIAVLAALMIDARTRHVMVVLDRDVTARLAPSGQSLAVAEWQTGDRLRLYLQTEDWARVERRGLTAWIPADALQREGQ